MQRAFALLRGRWLLPGPALLALFMTLLALSCGDDGSSTPAPDQSIAGGDRVTLSIALHDGVGQRTALYAIENAIVSSDQIDIVPTYLTAAELEEATGSRQYDVVEAPILTVPVGKTEGRDFVIVSAGLQDLDGTLLFSDAQSDTRTLAELRNGALGVVSLGDPATLETRILLQQRHGVKVDVLENGSESDMAIQVAPAQSLAALLHDDQLDAAIATQQSAYFLSNDPNVRLLANVTAGLREIADAPIANSLLLTYPDVAARKATALAELTRLLTDSKTYFEANRTAVSEDVAAELGLDPTYIEWWEQRYDVPLGTLSASAQDGILFMWEGARALGDLDSYPDLAEVVFDPETAETTPGANE